MLLNGRHDFQLAMAAAALMVVTVFAGLRLARQRTASDARVITIRLACGAALAALGIGAILFGTVAARIAFLLGMWALAVLDRSLGAPGKSNPRTDSEAYFRTLTKTAPGMIWTARPDGVVDFANEQMVEYGGVSLKDRLDRWETFFHPDDVAITLTKWRAAVQTGNAYEIEYRLRRADGVYRWFLARANPIRSEDGKITKWFGTCLDIEDQKHTQQILEEEIKKRTEELADANTRLQEEMLEKDFARRELDEQNDRIMRDLTERSQRATLLAKMGELLQSCITKDEVFSAALGFAPRIFPLTPGAVALLNGTRNLAEIIGSWAECKLPAPVFEPTACWALRTGHPHLVVAGDATAPCAHALGVKHTYLCIPIQAQGEALGIMHFQATDEAPILADSELSFKTTFAGQVGLSIANIRLREALRGRLRTP